MILALLYTCYRDDYKIIENKEFIFTLNGQSLLIVFPQT